MNIFIKKIHISILTLILIGIGSTTPLAVYAQTETVVPQNAGKSYTLLSPLPCIPSPASTDSRGNPVPAVTCQNVGGDGALQENVDFEKYVQYMFNLVIALAAVAAVFMIVWGGFKYVTTDSFSGKSQGKEVIWQAIQGLLLVLCSFIILRTIDPRLVAIPTNLVAPLDISVKKGATADFFKKLSSQSDRNALEARLAVRDAQIANESITGENLRIAELEEMIAKDPNSAASLRMREEITTIKNGQKYKDASYEKEVSLAKSTIRLAIKDAFNKVIEITQAAPSTVSGSVNGNAINKTIEDYIEFVDVVRVQRLSSLNAIAAPKEVLVKVDNEANFAQAILLLKKTQSRISRAVIEVSGTKEESVSYVSFGEGVLNYSVINARKVLTDDISKALVKMSRVTDSDLKNELHDELEVVNYALNQKFGN